MRSPISPLLGRRRKILNKKSADMAMFAGISDMSTASFP